MPTKKRRVGFIPRSEVLNLLNKLSFENNLSISKIINNLVEEALYKRGMFNIKTGKSLNKTDLINLSIENNEKTKIINKNFSSEFTNAKNQNINEANEDFIDNDIYAKFLIFLQFQERMKSNNT